MPRAKATEAAPRGDGFTIAEALTTSDRQPESQDDFEKNVGRNMMSAMLSGVGQIVERGLAGATRAVDGNGGGGGSFREALEVLKLMREVGLVDDGGGSKRRGGDSESSTATILKVLMESQNSTTKLILETQSKAEERTAKLIETMSKDNKEMLKELRDELKGGGKGDSATDLLAKIGADSIRGAMSRDPVAEFAHMKNALETVLGRPLNSSETADLDKELALEKVKVERERIASEERRFDKEMDSRGQLIGGALTALGNRRGGEDGSSDLPDELPRFKCGACGEEFILRKPRAQAICPACGVMLNTSGKAETPPPAGQGDGENGEGQTPPPQPHPPAQAPNDDDSGPDYLPEGGAAY